MKFKSDIEVQAGLRDGSDDIGTAGQILSSTGSQTNWIDQSSISVSAKLVVIACKNTSGATITKGTPVYQTGTVGATDVIEIAEADASDEDKMAAIGLLQTDINNNDFGNVVITGELLNFTTDPIDGVTPVTGDTIYVKSGGGLTLTKPTGLEFIQNVGLVGKVSGGNAGSITVSSIMRSNDVPTPLYIDHDNQRLGIGATSPSAKLEVMSSSQTLSTAKFDSIELQTYTVNNSWVGENLYYDGSFKYRANGYATALYFDTSGFDIRTAPSGTAGTVAPLTTRFTILENSGNVGIGTTSPGAKLEISHSGSNDGLLLENTNNVNNYQIALNIRENEGLIYQRWTGGAFNANLMRIGYTGAITFDAYNSSNNTGTPTYLLGTDASGNVVKTLSFDPPTGTTQFFNQSNLYNNTTPGVTGYGNVAIDASVSFYDTGKNVATTSRGLAWNGRYYMLTNQSNNTVKFYDNNFDSVTNAEAASITLPSPGTGSSPHGATWDGRYLSVLWLSPLQIVSYDLDNGTTTATVVNSTNISANSANTYDLEYAEGHFYTCAGGAISKFKVEGKTVTHVLTTGNILGGITAQAITYDGSHLWFTVNGGYVYKVTLDCALVSTLTTGFTPDNIGWAWNGQNIASCSYTTGNVYIINTAETRFDTEQFLVMGGNVGIGTDSPEALLHVKAGNGVTGVIKVEGGKDIVTSVGEINSQIDFGSNDSSVWSSGNIGGRIASVTEATNGALVGMAFSTFSQGSSSPDVLSEKVRIKHNGNVGIGTTSPDVKLHIRGAANGTDGKFYITEDASNGSFFKYDGATNRGSLGGLSTGGEGTVIDWSRAGSEVRFLTGNSERMRIDSSGNVGIGVTSPGEKLSVNGNLRIFGTDTNAIQFENSVSGTRFHYIIPHYNASYSNLNSLEFQISSATPGSELSVMTLNGAGNVGIGTTSPSEKLEVDGNIKIQSALLSNQENTNVDTGAEVVAQVSTSTYTAAFFDFVIKKVGNIRSGTVYACHDGTSVEFTETSTNDLGDTSDVTLSVDISGTNLRLIATVTSDDWIIKSLIRAI